MRIKITITAIFIVQVAFYSAQEKYRAVRWGMNEGLSAETNNVMLKDVNGFYGLALCMD